MKTAEIGAKLEQALDVRPPKTARKRKTAVEKVTISGVKYSLFRVANSPNYRIRRRGRGIKIDESLGVSDLDEAKRVARERVENLDGEKTRKSAGGATLREIIEVYLAMSKRCSDDAAEANAQRITKIVDYAWGKKPENVRGQELNALLWEAYAAKRQGGQLNLSRRSLEARGINAAMRMAVSMFHKGLKEGYRRAGITLDFESIRRVCWLPEIKVKVLPLATEALDRMHAALDKLKDTNRPMWRAIMIAEHAGLRSSEISAARKSWLEKSPHTGKLRFAIHDRPEEGYWHKTGEDYTAPILSKDLEDDLKACPDDEPLVPVKGSRDNFFRKICNRWLRRGDVGPDGKTLKGPDGKPLSYIAKPHKGMHRLRALYLERIRDDRAAQIRTLAEESGVEAARQAAGHTSSETTTTHYLPAA